MTTLEQIQSHIKEAVDAVQCSEIETGRNAHVLASHSIAHSLIAIAKALETVVALEQESKRQAES